MQTLIQLTSDTRLWSLLLQRYPELQYEPVATVDEMVIEFLRQHDVFVKPVSSKVSASSGMNAAMGAIGGPIAVGINQALTAQAKGLALQEWTSWKQWALGHADWPGFRARIEARQLSTVAKTASRLNEPEIQEYIAKLKKDQCVLDATQTRHKVLAVLSIAGLALIGLVFSIPNQTELAKPVVESKTELKPALDSDPSEVCRLKAQKAGEEGGNKFFVGARADTHEWAQLVFQKPSGEQWEADYACE